MVKVGKEEGGLVGPELSKKSPGPSWQLSLRFVYFWRRSVDDVVVRDSR